MNRQLANPQQVDEDIPKVRFIKLIIYHLRTKHNIHPRTGSPLHYSYEESVLNTLTFVGKDGREVFGMPIPDALLTDEIIKHGKAEEEDVTESPKAAKATKSKTPKQTKPSAPKTSKVIKPPKPTPTTTEPSKKDQTGKVTKQQKPKSPLQLVNEFVDEGVPEQEPVYGDEEADIQRAVELSIKETKADHQEHKIAEKDFKNMYPNDFKDLNFLLLQGHLNHLSGEGIVIFHYEIDKNVVLLKTQRRRSIHSLISLSEFDDIEKVAVALAPTTITKNAL
ncbi:hypothetical protein Tco_0901405 [Tanacetum coccineum]